MCFLLIDRTRFLEFKFLACPVTSRILRHNSRRQQWSYQGSPQLQPLDKEHQGHWHNYWVVDSDKPVIGSWRVLTQDSLLLKSIRNISGLLPQYSKPSSVNFFPQALPLPQSSNRYALVRRKMSVPLHIDSSPRSARFWKRRQHSSDSTRLVDTNGWTKERDAVGYPRLSVQVLHTFELHGAIRTVGRTTLISRRHPSNDWMASEWDGAQLHGTETA